MAPVPVVQSRPSKGPAVRVVGYIRESVGEQESASAFAQSEKIRRWVGEHGHRVVAVCQDAKTPGHALGSDGLRALLGIVDAGQVDGVIIADLATLSSDVVVQEVVLWDLRNRGARVLSTDEADVVDLADPPSNPTRMMIRDVLARVSDHLAYFVTAASDTAVIDLLQPDQAPAEIPVHFVRAAEQ